VRREEGGGRREGRGDKSDKREGNMREYKRCDAGVRRERRGRGHLLCGTDRGTDWG
jgi:hypothetical protein